MSKAMANGKSSESSENFLTRGLMQFICLGPLPFSFFMNFIGLYQILGKKWKHTYTNQIFQLWLLKTSTVLATLLASHVHSNSAHFNTSKLNVCDLSPKNAHCCIAYFITCMFCNYSGNAEAFQTLQKGEMSTFLLCTHLSYFIKSCKAWRFQGTAMYFDDWWWQEVS